MPEPDEGTDHAAAVTLVLGAARVLLTVDLDAVIANAQRALELGPFIDPTAWREKGEDLRVDLETLRAALPLYRRAAEYAKRTKGPGDG